MISLMLAIIIIITTDYLQEEIKTAGVLLKDLRWLPQIIRTQSLGAKKGGSTTSETDSTHLRVESKSEQIRNYRVFKYA